MSLQLLPKYLKLIEKPELLLRTLGCVVIDELHFLGDAYRGWTLEMLVATFLLLVE